MPGMSEKGSSCPKTDKNCNAYHIAGKGGGYMPRSPPEKGYCTPYRVPKPLEIV